MDSTPSDRGPGRREKLLLVVILLAGAALRVAYLLQLLGWRYAREVLFAGDGLMYREAASRILAGGPWGVPVSWLDPLYPTFLALVTRLTESDLAGPLAAQNILGLLSAALAWAIGRRIPSPASSRRHSWRSRRYPSTTRASSRSPGRASSCSHWPPGCSRRGWPEGARRAWPARAPPWPCCSSCARTP